MGHERHRRLIAERRENALRFVFLAGHDHAIVARHRIEHCARDVRDQVAERIDFDDFAFNAIRHLLHLRPRHFHELLVLGAQ